MVPVVCRPRAGVSAWLSSIQCHADGSADSSSVAGTATGAGSVTTLICGTAHVGTQGKTVEKIGLCIESGTTESQRKSFPVLPQV